MAASQNGKNGGKVRKKNVKKLVKICKNRENFGKK